MRNGIHHCTDKSICQINVVSIIDLKFSSLLQSQEALFGHLFSHLFNPMSAARLLFIPGHLSLLSSFLGSGPSVPLSLGMLQEIGKEKISHFIMQNRLCFSSSYSKSESINMDVDDFSTYVGDILRQDNIVAVLVH